MAPTSHGSRRTPRGPLVVGGLLLQVVGAAIPAWIVYSTAKREVLLGEVSKYTVRLAWQDTIHQPSHLALVTLGLVIYVAGAVTMARAFIRQPAELWIAVPIAALVGLFVLGVIAIFFAILIGILDSHEMIDLTGWGSSGPRRNSDDESSERE